eukprot:9265623-Pyramimonas_sp.AAC.1
MCNIQPFACVQGCGLTPGVVHQSQLDRTGRLRPLTSVWVFCRPDPPALLKREAPFWVEPWATTATLTQAQ